MIDEFREKVQYIIKDVEIGKDTFEISIEDLKNKPKYTKEQIKEAINAETYSRAGEILEGFKRSNDTSGAKTWSELASGGTEKRSNEVQRINTGTDRDFGRVPGGGNGEQRGDLTPENPDGNKVNMTWNEYQKNKRSMPLYLAIAHGQQTPLLQAAVPVSGNNISHVEQKTTSENENSVKNDAKASRPADRNGDVKTESQKIAETARFALAWKHYQAMKKYT